MFTATSLLLFSFVKSPLIVTLEPAANVTAAPLLIVRSSISKVPLIIEFPLPKSMLKPEPANEFPAVMFQSPVTLDPPVKLRLRTTS